jgi:hypothetical protein
MTKTVDGKRKAPEDTLVQYFRCPAESLPLKLDEALTGRAGYFRFGPEAICFGQLARGQTSSSPVGRLEDAEALLRLENSKVSVPFDVSQVVTNLRRERYVRDGDRETDRGLREALIRRSYYLIRPLLSVRFRRYLQQVRLRDWGRIPFPRWPVDCTVDEFQLRLIAHCLTATGVERVPFIWFWPEGRTAAVMLTHDIETAAGRDFSPALMDLDDSYGIKSSFQVVPEGRYEVPKDFLDLIRQRGFEVNVHDLNHDGQLLSARYVFFQRVKRINEYGRKFDALGFRAGALYRNLDWFDALEFEYDMSVPNVGHLEAQRGGCCTVMPYFLGDVLELPLTTTQDYSLFHILGDYSIELWKRQIAVVAERHGLVSFVVHPDYIIQRRARSTYAELLAYLVQTSKRLNMWVALPREINSWWRARSQMRLVRGFEGWRIEGPEAARARVSWARLADGRLTYEPDANGVP